MSGQFSQQNVAGTGEARFEGVEAEQAAQQQQTITTAVDYKGVFTNMLPMIRDNRDLLNFAYYLYKQELVKEYQQDDDAWISIRQRVNFCNSAKMRSYDSTMNASRLEQMYTADVFGGAFYTTLWAKKEYLPGNMRDRCAQCSGCDQHQFPFCPYFLCHVIVKAAETYQVSPQTIFDDLLGSEKIDFRGMVAYKLNVQIPQECLQGINSKSAYAAYLMLVSKLIHIRSQENSFLHYTYLPVCRGDKRDNMVMDMVEFWKNHSGVSGMLDVSDRISLLQTKTDGCQRCTYMQCPHKLAAYFIYLAGQYGVDAIDLAYDVAKNNTYAGISVSDNYQFDRFVTNVLKSPMREESKAEYIKMIHFIAGRKKNTAIPFLPFNMVISSPDREKADEVFDDFTNALWHFDYYRRGLDATKSKKLYLSSITFQKLCEEYYNAKPGTTFALYDVGLMCDNESFKALYHQLLKYMEDRRNDVMTVIIGDKTEVSMFFATYPVFKSKIFTKTLEMVDMDYFSVLEALEDKLTATFTISEEMHQRLDQYIRIAYPASPLQGMEFVNDLYEQLLFNHYNHDVNAGTELRFSDLPYMKPPRSEQSIFEELDQLTGLDNVKQELRNVNNLVKFNIKMGANSKNAVNMHMVFTGNPGTGKTTVARLTAEILHSVGFIQENKVVICSAKDLIGQYTGQTTPKTAQKCEMAYNGVLFIDEAYQLNPYTSHQTDTFKEECIAELIQQMENNRDRLVVIFAGYTDEMEDFLNRANTGLRSRIGKTIHFPDYSTDELLEIFEKTVKKAGMRLGEGAAEKARDIINIAKWDTQRFGNARFARNLYERSLMQHAAITANMDKDDPELKILHSDEITMPNA